MKQESHYTEDNFFNEDSMDQNHVESDPVLAFEEPVADAEERQMAVMEKLVHTIHYIVCFDLIKFSDVNSGHLYCLLDGEWSPLILDISNTATNTRVLSGPHWAYSLYSYL